MNGQINISKKIMPSKYYFETYLQIIDGKFVIQRLFVQLRISYSSVPNKIIMFNYYIDLWANVLFLRLKTLKFCNI